MTACRIRRASSNRRELLKIHRRELIELVEREIPFRLNGRVNADLPHVSVATVLVIADDCDLDHESSDWVFADVLDGDDDPTGRLTEVDYFDFIEIIKVRAAADGDS